MSLWRGREHRRQDRYPTPAGRPEEAHIDHYNQGRTGVVGLDGKLKKPAATQVPAANVPAKTGRVGLDGKLKSAPGPAPIAPYYVVGGNGKHQLVPQLRGTAFDLRLLYCPGAAIVALGGAFKDFRANSNLTFESAVPALRSAKSQPVIRAEFKASDR